MILTKEEIEQNERDRREYGEHWADIDHQDGRRYYGADESRKEKKEMTTKLGDDYWTAQQLERDREERYADAYSEMDMLAKIGQRGVPSSWNNSSIAAAKSVATTSDQVVNDIMHQLRVQMEPAFVANFIASLKPETQAWIAAHETVAQTKVQEILKASGMTLDQLKALLNNNSQLR